MKQQIANQKIVRKAAEAVWAANKYYILACDQNAYRDVRKFLRADHLAFTKAFHTLAETEEKYRNIQTDELPQIRHALYHMAGYFKQKITNHDRQNLHQLIQAKPHEALQILEQLTTRHNIDYLLQSRIWQKCRETPFNLVPIAIKNEGEIIPAKQLKWIDDYLLFAES